MLQKLGSHPKLNFVLGLQPPMFFEPEIRPSPGQRLAPESPHPAAASRNPWHPVASAAATAR